MPRLGNARRELFAIEVASGTPLDRAYTVAGFKGGKWARPNASKLAHKTQVAERIAELQGEYAVMGGLQVGYIQAKLLPLIEADIRELFEIGPGGLPRLRKLTELPDGIAAALSSVKVDRFGDVTEFKIASRNDAAKTLLQSIGAITEQHLHAYAHGDLGDRLEAAFARVRENLASDATAALSLPADDQKIADDLEGAS